MKPSYKENTSINWSTLKYMKLSALDYLVATKKPFKQSPEQKLGTYVHCGLLEPEELEGRYLTVPEIKWNSKINKAETVGLLFHHLNIHHGQDEVLKFKKEELEDWVRLQTLATGKEPIPFEGEPFSQEKGQRIIEQNRIKPAWKKLIESKEAVEQELYAECEVTGLPLKGLADIITTNSLIDLKTVGIMGKYRYNIRAYDYLGQLAFYDYLCRLNGIVKTQFMFCFIETVSPYKMKIVSVDPRIITAEHEKNIELLKQLKVCRDTDRYPDGSDQIETYDYLGETDSDSGLPDSDGVGEDEL